VLVRVHAAALNPLDWHSVRGEPYVMRLDAGLGAPKDPRVGVDFAGVVDEVGPGVTRFRAGDAVFGAANGALAEYVVVRADRAIAPLPPGVSFEQAAAVPVAAITALQALRDHGRVRAGQKVLVNGASGGVGTFAVQLAKTMDAEVTGVCSTRNVALVQSLGADHVVDYTREDFRRAGVRYDAIVDNVGNHPLLSLRAALTPDGTVVVVGGEKGDPWLGPVTRLLGAVVLSPFVSQRFEPFLAHLDGRDLEHLAGLMAEGRLRAAIDRRYPLEQVAAALEYLESGRARGKVVVTIADDAAPAPAVAGPAVETPAAAAPAAPAPAAR
jgi:NADPH:quinone reductase-like Zn-dependent oxidoreductase